MEKRKEKGKERKNSGMSRVTKGDREERCVTNCSVEQEKKRMVDRGMIEKESERKRERVISLRFPIRKREIDPRILIGERAIYFPSVYFTLFENRRILQTFPCLRSYAIRSKRIPSHGWIVYRENVRE